MKDINYQIFIQILADFINEKVGLYDNINKCDLSAIYELAIKNNVSGILYYQLRHCNVNKEFLKKLENDFLLNCVSSVNNEVETNAINKILNECGIEHIFLKGVFLKKLYPVPEMRSMGDVDILIKADSQELVKNVLIRNQYEYDHRSSLSNVWDYKKNNVLFEIHSAVVYDNFKSDVNFVSYFKNAFEDSGIVSEYEYSLNINYNFIYLITHLAKHYYCGGAGIRMFMDISLFIEKFADEMNIEQIIEETKKLKLYKFLCLTNAICNMWFGTRKCFDDYNISGDLYIEITNYVLNGGVFGFYNDGYLTSELSRHTDNFNKSNNKFNVIFRYLFPNDDYMRFRYEWYSKLPVFFYQ